MTTIILDEEAYNYLAEWTEDRKQAVTYSPYYFKKVMLLLKGYDEAFKFFVEATRYGYKCSLLYCGNVAVRGRIIHNTESEHDFDLEFDFGDSARDSGYSTLETIIRIMQIHCTAFIEANCFMWYGNVLDDEKTYTVAGKTDRKKGDKIYTFRKFKDTIYAVPVGHHRSPEGVFEVRGHFRSYKDGKVIWIDPYLKGLEDSQE